MDNKKQENTSTMEQYSLSRALSVFAPREAVAELWVSELMQAARGRHAEVAPHILTAAEVELLHGARARLETLRTNSGQQWSAVVSSGQH